MQVGFFFWPYTPELCELLAERADRYGYAMIGVADTPGNAMDPWVSAAIVARSCRRARVAICVTNLISRHPAVSAAAIASLDRLANGRAVLGIGAGHSGTKNVGLAKSRAHELADGVTFIKTLLRGEPASLAGASAHLPWVKRAPPVFLAASHPKPLQAAGATADGVFVNYGLIGAATVLSAGTALAGLCYCLAGLGSGFVLLVLALLLGGVGAATQHPIGSALVTRTFSGARSLKAFGAYNFAGDVGKVLLPATATSLLLILPWRPAYTLLGLVGIVAAIAIAILTPRVAPEPQPASAELALGEHGEGDSARRFGFRILVLFGITDSVVRGSFFVCLPFLLIGKGAAVTTAGFALTLVFIGGAAGKLACGWIGNWLGNRATIAICQTLTAVGIAVVLLLPLQLTLVMLPFVGLVLNGVTTVIYGSVPNHAAPERRTHLLSVFYTISIGAAAVSPPVAGFLSDLIGIPGTIIVVCTLTLATIPFAFLIKDLRRTASV